jgi:hypothetical protein
MAFSNSVLRQPKNLTRFQETKSTFTGARSKSAALIKVWGFNRIILAKSVSGTISKRVL